MSSTVFTTESMLETKEFHAASPEVERLQQLIPKAPKEKKSLLSKYLTAETWDSLVDVRDSFGFSLYQLIRSGVCIPTSTVGMYAGSHDSYRAFAMLLDPAIEEYHGHSPTARHVTCMDPCKLLFPALPSHEAAHILSVRIRVARNLSDFPFGAAITSRQRMQVEQVILHALSKLPGRLGGKYYALSAMAESDRQRLVDDHFLFKAGDAYMQASGHERDWPHSRGIFHNEEKTLLAWVNEEDHLRLISMQQGADVMAVFARLRDAIDAIDAAVEFARDDHIGYATSCLTNLGTGMRASMHVRLPRLGERREQMEAIAREFELDVRGVDGEHSEATGGVFDISNARRLGFTETQLVQNMYNGVRKLIYEEQKCKSLLDRE